ncbi:MAG: hypothetical protein HYU66_28850 [Armatimonadetes bacterium]|nr:hypothetical protein [Armatimonadota bacterium]
MSTNEILGLARNAYAAWERQEGKGLGLTFAPDGVREEEGWYYLVVTATNRPRRSFEYYDYLHEIETLVEKELDPEGKIHVLLVPALANVV